MNEEHAAPGAQIAFQDAALGDHDVLANMHRHMTAFRTALVGRKDRADLRILFAAGSGIKDDHDVHHCGLMAAAAATTSSSGSTSMTPPGRRSALACFGRRAGSRRLTTGAACAARRTAGAGSSSSGGTASQDT